MSRRAFRLASASMMVFLTGAWARGASAEEEKKDAKPPMLKVVEAENNKISLPVASPSGKIILHVEETGGGGATNVSAFVRLRTPEGSPAERSCALKPAHNDASNKGDASAEANCGAPITLAPNAWGELEITPTISEFGKYTGYVLLMSDKVRLKIDIEFVYQAPDFAAPAEVFGSAGNASIDLRISRLTAQHDKLQFDIRTIKGTDKISFLEPQSAGGPPKLDRPLTLSGLPFAGDCEGELILLADGKQLSTKTIKIFTRFHWGWGFGAIGLGVAASGLARYFGQNRPKVRNLKKRVLLGLRRLEQFEKAASVAGALDPREAEILKSLRDMLSGISEQLRYSSDLAEDGHIINVETKVVLFEAWVPVFRRRKALHVEGEDRASLDAQLSTVEAAIRAKPADALDLAAMQKVLTEADVAIDKVLSGLADALTKEVRTLPPKMATEMQEILAKIEKSNHARGDSSKTEEAIKLFDEARLLYAKVQARVLLDNVSGAQPSYWPKTGPNTWIEFRKDVGSWVSAVEAESNADAAASRYRNAYFSYLKRQLDALKARKVTFDEKLKAELDKDPGNDRKQALEEADNTLTKALTTAEEQLVVADFAKAQIAFEAAVKIFDESSKVVDGGMRQSMDVLSLVTSLVSAPGASLIGSLGALVKQVIQPAPRDVNASPLNVELLKLERMSAWDEVAIGSVVAIVAIVLGAHVLDLFSPNWGTSKDLLTAFLWSVGLSQAAGSTFMGLPAIREKLTNPTKPNP